ncbi:hypothetical protein HY389_00100 [Candidatus Daviesbacteria bacterium]|nr:hypothetical protein [Candidatus Daviesbacteria bacterium]
MAKREAVEIEFGQEFFPFAGMERLIKGHTSDVIGRSNDFYLRNVGKGRICLDNTKATQFEEQNFNLLCVAGYPRQTALRKIDQVYGWIGADIDNDTNLSRLGMQMSWGEMNFVAQNLEPEDFIILGDFWVSGMGGKRRHIGNLWVPLDMSFLQQLKFKFI